MTLGYSRTSLLVF